MDNVSTPAPFSSGRQSKAPASPPKKRGRPLSASLPFRPDHLAEYLRASGGRATVSGAKWWADDRFWRVARWLYPDDRSCEPEMYSHAKFALMRLAKCRNVGPLLAEHFERVNASTDTPEMGTLYIKKGRGEWLAFRPKPAQPG